MSYCSPVDQAEITTEHKLGHASLTSSRDISKKQNILEFFGGTSLLLDIVSLYRYSRGSEPFEYCELFYAIKSSAIPW